MGSTRGKNTAGAKEKKFRKIRKCVVPGCKTGHSAAQTGKLSPYRLPKNAERRQAWARSLQRDVQKLCNTTHVCELHFEPRYIQRDFVHIIDGKEVRMPRAKATLTSDAVPTIFRDDLGPPPSFSPSPKSPEELTEWRKTTLHTTDEQQRSDSVEQGEEVITDDRAVEEDTSDADPESNTVVLDITNTTVQETSPATSPSEILSGQEMLLQLQTPAGCWSCLKFPSFKGAVYVSSWFNDLSSEVITERTVVFRPQRYPDVNCQVYIGRTLIQECLVTTVKAAEEALAMAGETELCKRSSESL
uniref:THAP-type domain-containing protein n=1 Tax=Ixodes ricinus TaxID=34613 RepID=A0A0K8RES2_IXORI